MAALQGIEQVLRRSRLRLVIHHLLRWLLEAASGWIVLLALGAVALLVGSPAVVRALVFAAAALCSGGLLVYSVLLPLRPVHRRETLALLVERRLPALRNFLLSSLQLAVDLDHPERRRGFSDQLARAHIAEASRRAGAADLAALAPLGPLRQRALFTGLLLGALALGLLISPQGLGRSLAVLWQGDAAAGRLDAASAVPLVGDLTLRYVYPAYSGLPPAEIDGSDGNLRGLRGTSVTISGHTLLPARRAFLALEGQQQTIAAPVGPDRRFTATLVLQQDGAYRFGLTDADGDSQVEGRTRPLTVLPDEPPQVRLEEPATDLELDELAEIRLAWGASDDFGLTRAELVIRGVGGPGAGRPAGAVEPDEDEAPGAPPDAPPPAGAAPASAEQPPQDGPLRRRPLPLEAEVGREATGATTVSLGELGIEPGQEIELWVELTDNDTVRGPKVGASPHRRIVVRSAQQRHDAATARTREVWEGMIRHLGTRLELEPAQQPAQWPAKKGGVQAMLAEGGALAQATAELLELLRLDPLAGTDVVAALDGFHERLGGIQQAEAERVGEANRRADEGRLTRQQLTDLTFYNDRAVTELERTVLAIDKLLDRMQVQDLQELGRQLMRAQEKLRDLLRRYQKTQDPALKAEIEQEMRRLRAQVADLMRRFAAQMKKLPFDHVNADALQGKGAAEQAAQFEQRLAAMEQRLAAGDVQGALDELERFGGSLQSMLGALDEDAKEQEQDSIGVARREMGAILEELQATEAAQRKLEEETGRIEQEQDQRQRAQLQQKLDEVVRGLLAKLEQIQQRLGETPGTSLPDQSLDSFKQAGRAARQLRHSLTAPDLDQALEVARALRSSLEETLEGLGLYLTVQQPGEGGQLRAARDKLDTADRLAEEIEAELSELLQQARQLRPQASQQQLERLAQRQQSLAERTRRAQERLQGLDESAPLQAKRRAEELQQAMQEMGDAQQRLQQGQPREARPAEGRAAEQLRRVGQQMAESIQPKRMGQSQPLAAGQEEGQGGRSNTDRVRIPGAAEHQSPREFREELLRAMKQGAPEQYKEQLRGYYRELVK